MTARRGCFHGFFSLQSIAKPDPEPDSGVSVENSILVIVGVMRQQRAMFRAADCRGMQVADPVVWTSRRAAP
ncbi:MAG: hypothetical protein P8Z78_11415, partial [Gammaproteobacteria bacterium]